MSDTVVRVDDLEVTRGSRVVLSGATFTVDRGEVVVLMGASGSGKTTMLRAVAGLETFGRGRVVVDDVVREAGASEGRVLRALRRKVGMVFQFHHLFDHLPAVQNVSLAPVHVHRVRPADAERRALELLRALGVEHRARALPRELSGGEAQRVAIARALATDPPVLLMDEPTASLDPARRLELGQLVRSLVSRQRTLVVATHDEDFAGSVATRVLHMRDGRIVDR